jgi:integrase
VRPAGPHGNGEKLNKNSLSDVKSLCSGIFSKALPNEGKRHQRQAMARSQRIREGPQGQTAGEVHPTGNSSHIAILNALTQPEAKLFFAFCAVLALRPEETAAVKWENIDLTINMLMVREAAPYGELGELKTERSKRDLNIFASLSRCGPMLKLGTSRWGNRGPGCYSPRMVLIR